MSTTTAVFISVLCLSMCAAAAEKNAPPTFACNLKAISAADRSRYHDLAQKIRAAMYDRTELAAGYTFRLDSKRVTFLEAAEWISLERLCCPFLTLHLSTSGNHADSLLALTGPTGVKPLLLAEFPYSK